MPALFRHGAAPAGGVREVRVLVPLPTRPRHAACRPLSYRPSCGPSRSFFSPGAVFSGESWAASPTFSPRTKLRPGCCAALASRGELAGDTRFDTVVATAAAPPRSLPLIEAFVADGAPGAGGRQHLARRPARPHALAARAQPALRAIIAPHEISEAHLRLVEHPAGPGGALFPGHAGTWPRPACS